MDPRPKEEFEAEQEEDPYGDDYDDFSYELPISRPPVINKPPENSVDTKDTPSYKAFLDKYTT